MDKWPAVARATHVGLDEQRQAHVEDRMPVQEEGDDVDRASQSVVELSPGGVSQTVGDLAEAESSLLVHLELYEWLGSEEGMADAYGNLGMLYQSLGDLAPAEAMYKEALKLDEALGRKEIMGATCRSLARISETQGDSAQATALYKKSIVLFEEVGATREVLQLQRVLDRLTAARRAFPAGK